MFNKYSNVYKMIITTRTSTTETYKKTIQSLSQWIDLKHVLVLIFKQKPKTETEKNKKLYKMICLQAHNQKKS